MCHQRLLNGLSAGRFENGDVTEDRLKSVCFNSYFFFITLKQLKMKFKANTLNFKRQSWEIYIHVLEKSFQLLIF